MRGQKKYILKGGIILFLLFSLETRGQLNLVLNSSFEQYTGSCSTATFNFSCTGSTINNWYAPNFGSPDWYNICEPPAGWGVPANETGYQYPHAGDAYSGIFINDNPINGTIREYVTGTFSSALNASKKYCVNFYVSLADSMWYATGAIGAYISGHICQGGNGDSLAFIPQIENPFSNVLKDKLNWIPISGEYKALGGELNITIGDFNGDTITGYDSVGNGGGVNWQNVAFNGHITYYYIDDISVREIIEAHAGKDTEICNNGMALLGLDTVIGVSYHWQPTMGLANPNSAQTLASPTVTTIYTLTVVNDSMKGCNCPDSISRDSVTVTVCPELPDNIFIPDAFSPNNDGQNDMLLAKGNGVETFYMAIYDRWGNKVFETYNFNIGWDGTYKGKPEDAGTYVYYVNGTYADGTAFNKKGSVALVR